MFTRLCLAKCKGKIAFPDDAHVLLLALFTFVCVSVCECVFLYDCVFLSIFVLRHDILVMHMTHFLCIASHEGEMIMTQTKTNYIVCNNPPNPFAKLFCLLPPFPRRRENGGEEKQSDNL